MSDSPRNHDGLVTERTAGGLPHRRPAPGRLPNQRSDQSGLAILTIYICLVYLVPGFYTLGFVGTPATICGLVALLAWSVRRYSDGKAVLASDGLRYAVILFCVAIVASFASTSLRHPPAVEMRMADRGVIFGLSMLGVVLLASDYLAPRMLDALLGRLVLLVGALGALAAVQYFTAIDIGHLIRPPLLTDTSDVTSSYGRAGLTRPSVTATHPIELSVTFALVMPVAVARALVASAGWQRLGRWMLVTLILTAIPLTISRAGILGLVAGFALTVPFWPLKWLLRCLAIAVGFIGALVAAAPALVHAITDLFTSIGTDDSTQSRIDAIPAALHYFDRSPVFGIGLFTFLPNRYVILDNEWLKVLVETGVFGFVALCVVIGAAFRHARVAWRKSSSEAIRQYGLALSAGVSCGIVTFYTFDAFSFQMASYTLFLFVGLSGAVARAALSEGRSRTENSFATFPAPTRRW